MAEAPKISILTPVWNGLPYLKECVDSVLSQDFQDWEMIVGDNCSDDGTTEYLRSLNDPRIKIHTHEKNLGVYGNIHFLFNQAKAPIYVGLCADDYFYDGALRKIVDEWNNVSPGTGLISYNWKSRQMKHNKLTRFAYSALPKKLDGVNATAAYFLFGCFPGNFSEISGRVSLVAPEHFWYHVRYSADHEFWLRLTKKSGIHLSDAKVVYIRRHDKVAATRMITKGEYHEESIEIYESIINELSAHCSRGKLVAFYNVELCSFHLRDAIKSAMRGKFTALKSFIRLESPIFWPKWFQLIGCLPFALSETLRFPVSIMLAKSILKDLNEQQVTSNLSLKEA
ncbi:MAG TPA: glycosyltransferase family 2 protein [Chryseolinea sp.]